VGIGFLRNRLSASRGRSAAAEEAGEGEAIGVRFDGAGEDDAAAAVEEDLARLPSRPSLPLLIPRRSSSLLLEQLRPAGSCGRATPFWKEKPE